MRKRSFILFVFVFTSFFAQAQDAAFTPSREIGMNSNFIISGIFNSGSAPMNVMYKSVKGNSAIRIGMVFSLNANSSFSDEGLLQNKNNGFDLGITVGKEWLKNINQHWVFYYGVDALPSIGTTTEKVYAGGNIATGRGSSRVGLEGRPFLGIRFNINESLYVATEASFFMSMYYRKNYIDVYNESSTTRVENSSVSFTSGLRPLNGIYVFYRF